MLSIISLNLPGQLYVDVNIYFSFWCIRKGAMPVQKCIYQTNKSTVGLIVLKHRLTVERV